MNIGLKCIDGKCVTTRDGNLVREYVITVDEKVTTCEGSITLKRDQNSSKKPALPLSPYAFIKQEIIDNIDTGYIIDGYSDEEGIYDFVPDYMNTIDTWGGKVIVTRINCKNNLHYCAYLDEVISIVKGITK